MLSSVFRHRLPEISSSVVLKDLIRSFSSGRTSSDISPPSWDLDKVLQALRSAPYEPLESASLRNLTKKTLFLVALATARRVGELQALSVRVAESGPDLLLSYRPGFVAKTESASNPIPRTFLLKSLGDFAASLEEELLLCPVRALRTYLDRTRDLPRRPQSLFISPRFPSRAISKNALSFFLRELISGAGAVGEDGGRPPRAHSIRGVSTSVAFMRNWSVAKVLEAATWKTNSVFASFYLKDVQLIFDSFRSLGAFVAAGQVIDTSFPASSS